eukprot:g8768.t1
MDNSSTPHSIGGLSSSTRATVTPVSSDPSLSLLRFSPDTRRATVVGAAEEAPGMVNPRTVNDAVCKADEPNKGKWPPNKVTVRAPATSANMGPGFDSLGIALDLWNEVTLEHAGDGKTSITIEGERVPGGLDLDPELNFVCRGVEIAYAYMGFSAPPPLKYHQVNRIPCGKGIGSSSAALVSGIMAALLLERFERKVPNVRAVCLDIANKEEGHPDNVAPCVLGGMQIATQLYSSAASSLGGGLALLGSSSTSGGAAGKDAKTYSQTQEGAKNVKHKKQDREVNVFTSAVNVPANLRCVVFIPNNGRVAESEEEHGLLKASGGTCQKEVEITSATTYGVAAGNAKPKKVVEVKSPTSAPASPLSLMNKDKPAEAAAAPEDCSDEGEDSSFENLAEKQPPANMNILRSRTRTRSKETKTEMARGLIPDTLPLKTAVFNISRAAFLINAMATGNLELLRLGVEDGIHQDIRGATIHPHLKGVMDSALKAGAKAVYLSGAGPAVMALCEAGTELGIKQKIECDSCRAGNHPGTCIIANPVLGGVERMTNHD